MYAIAVENIGEKEGVFSSQVTCTTRILRLSENKQVVESQTWKALLCSYGHICA